MAPVISNLDKWLLEVMDGQPREPRRYEFRCHPDVILAIRQASPIPAYPSLPGVGAVGLYGGADVIATPELGSGGWELHENGERIKSGRLGAEVA